MKALLAILVPLALAARSAGANPDAQALNGFFDGRGSIHGGDMRVGVLPRYLGLGDDDVVVKPLGLGQVGGTMILPVGTRFTALRLSVFNPWTMRRTDISVAADGGATFVRSPGAARDVRHAKLSETQLAALNRAWDDAGAAAGDRRLGERAPDAETFTLTYDFCGDAARDCAAGSVSGSLVPSVWTAQTAGVKSLVDRLQELERNLFSEEAPGK